MGGPSEQILIKVVEGQTTQKISMGLKAMEKAAMADQLKLTSKAVAGKRTLMVEGTRAAHERVKLMVKELAEKGESPMLSKALGTLGGVKPEIKNEVKSEVKVKEEPEDVDAAFAQFLKSDVIEVKGEVKLENEALVAKAGAVPKAA